MKTIKFRAWNKEENRILQGEPNFVNQHFYENENSKFPNLGTDFRVLVIMQFTGLLDKNGKEIYEGDIIRYNYHLNKNDKDTDFFGEVIYKIYEKEHHCCSSSRFVGFVLRGKEIDGEDWFTDIPDLDDVLVIGNVHENPELIPIL